MSPRPNPLKTANNQPVITYPCFCRNVSIENAAEQKFYFDFSFDDISIPLLGSSFIDDCAYSHSINGNINVTGMKLDVGWEYYKDKKLLDFDKLSTKYDMSK